MSDQKQEAALFEVQLGKENDLGRVIGPARNLLQPNGSAQREFAPSGENGTRTTPLLALILQQKTQ